MIAVAETQAIRKLFAEYYEQADFRIESVEQREFGIGNHKKIDARHLNFGSLGDFKRYLMNNTPLFVSHSISYYEFPGATPIQKKQWKAADLVFDLDIHAEGKYGAYEKFEAVKNDLICLVNDFILNDFGINRNNVIVVFSGNRGYHVHVREPSFLKLGGEERRELVDYVMGQGLDYLRFFSLSDSKPPKIFGPTPDEGGYRGRFAREVVKTLNQSPALISRKYSDQKEREFFISGINEGNWSRTFLKFDDLMQRVKPIADSLPISSVDTDAGVTQDLSKLIRVPNSVHGETGLIAKIIDGKTEGFNPWIDACLPSTRGQTMRVRFIEDVPKVQLDDLVGPFAKDDVKELPKSQAILFIAKGSAISIF